MKRAVKPQRSKPAPRKSLASKLLGRCVDQAGGSPKWRNGGGTLGCHFKFLTVRNLVLGQLHERGLFVTNRFHPAKSPVGAASSASMALLRSFDVLPFAL